MDGFIYCYIEVLASGANVSTTAEKFLSIYSLNEANFFNDQSMMMSRIYIQSSHKLYFLLCSQISAPTVTKFMKKYIAVHTGDQFRLCCCNKQDSKCLWLKTTEVISCLQNLLWVLDDSKRQLLPYMIILQFRVLWSFHLKSS